MKYLKDDPLKRARFCSTFLNPAGHLGAGHASLVVQLLDPL